ncbi:hypothetical protein [Helicobacter rodentium]|uniref:hypothetical protein n=1 Tax=Helicobacter rodentium TaxID=59617 RepID=UPI0025582F77|nr:hypothetical protein [Helicobacter rodentium]
MSWNIAPLSLRLILRHCVSHFCHCEALAEAIHNLAYINLTTASLRGISRSNP